MQTDTFGILRKKSSWLCMFFLFIMNSGFSQQHFVIKGSGSKMKNTDVIYLSYKIGGKSYLDSAKVSNKQFSFRGHIGDTPILANLYKNQNPTSNTVLYIEDSRSVYLESGTIHLKTQSKLTEAEVWGTVNNDTYQLWIAAWQPLRKEQLGIKDPDRFNAEELADTALLNKNNRLLNENYLKTLDLKLAFARKHPKSFVSLDLLYSISKHNAYAAKAEAVFLGLSDSLQNLAYADHLKSLFLQKKRIQVGQMAPDFSISSLEGQTYRLSEHRGKLILLDFWASWCLPCRNEHPELLRVYQEMKEKGFEIWSVSIDGKQSDWVKAVQEDGLPWPQLSDLKIALGEAYIQYGVTTIPANFLIDVDGKILARDLKATDLRNTLKSILSN